MEELLLKYEQGTCSASEAAQVEQWLEDNHWSHSSMDLYNTAVQHATCNKSVMEMLSGEGDYVDNILENYASDSTTQSESLWVEQLMENNEVDQPTEYNQYISVYKSLGSSVDFLANLDQEKLELADMPDVYQAYIEAQREHSTNIQAKEVILASESTDDLGSMPPAYQDYIGLLKSQNYAGKDLLGNDTPEKKESEGKVIKLNRNLWRAAAAIVLLVAGFFVVQNINNNQTTPTFAETIEITDPDEALAITLAALGAVGNELEAGNNELQKIVGIQKSDIFK